MPFTHNEKGMRTMSWSTDLQNVEDAVNVYGLDSYPGGFSCTNVNSGFNLVRTYYQWFSNYSYTQPNYFPEFEAGYFTPWGGSFPDDCVAEHNPALADVYYKNNIGQRTTLLSLYMAWGGTNWVIDKFYLTKLISLFTRVSTDLLKTYMVGNGTGYAAFGPGRFEIPITNAGFYTVQQATSNSRGSVTFSASLNTSEGVVTIPNINLNGRQSKILVTDYKFGNHTLLYSSANVLTSGIFDVDILVLYLQEGQVRQFALKTTPEATHSVFGTSEVSVVSADSSTTITYTQGSGRTVLKFEGVLIYLLEQKTAWKFWAPATATYEQSHRGYCGLPWSRSNTYRQGSREPASKWKAQGNAGGSANLNPVHSTFNLSSPAVGLASSGIRFYTTTVHLNIDSDLDVPLGIELTAPAGTVARVMIWINSYQYGKYVPHIGPQTKFPVPPRIINNRGLNTVALSLWAMTDAGAKLDTVKLIQYSAYQTDFTFGQDWSYLQPDWNARRLQYA
ncbi:beta-galactosidase, domain 2-domain-containing protein [Leptodontidium sp. MPI-SDFR-AT-0119]|nr:beta-galactosidase, domain 2-domain-containing protein [Leptodontidium sp. MPI-SDFR-AT-0119]